MLQSDTVDKILENMPESQRSMMREMMGSKMKIPTTKQCITADSFKDMEKRCESRWDSKLLSKAVILKLSVVTAKSFLES
jgi:hypothetical protein